MRIKFFALLLFVYFSNSAQKIKTINLKNFIVASLEQNLLETSGLCFYNDKLYSFNDGGNPSAVYEINPINAKTIKVVPTSIKNKDWEAITSDGNDIFLGDFGNNLGTRKDLSVYQLKLKNDTLKSVNQLSFEFSNQTNFTSQNRNHNFDVESMIFLENKLHIFTKEWKTKGTSHYIIEIDRTDKQKLVPLEFFKTKFILTDACFYNNQLYTIGYTKKGRCFLQLFDKDEHGLFFKDTPLKFRLGHILKLGQIEGIAVNQDGIYISSEGFSKSIFKVAPTLFFIPFSALKE